MKAKWMAKVISALFVVLISLGFFNIKQAEADTPPPQPRLSVSFDKASVNLGEWVTITANLRNYGGATSNGASVYLIFPTNFYAFGRERIQVLSHNFDRAEIYDSNGYLVVLASKNNWPSGADSSLRVKFQPSAVGMFFVNTSSRVTFWQNNQFRLYEDPSSGPKNSLDLYFNSHSIMVWQAAVVLPSPTAWIPPSPMPIPPTFISVPTRTPFPTFAPMPTITPMPTATRVIQSNNAPTPQPFFVSAPTATSQIFVNPTMTTAAVATAAATATAVQQQATQTPPPGAPTSVPVSAPTFAPESELRELEQLINDIKAEAELLRQELNQQGQQPTLGNIAGYEYPYDGIPDDFAFQRNLAQGASGEDVRYLHIFLNGLGCFVSFTDNESENEKSKFVSLTKEAVVCFQEKYAEEILSPWGLAKGTGYFGVTSRAKANRILEEAREERNRYLELQLIADNETIQAPPTFLESVREEAKEIFELVNDPAVSLALIPVAPEFSPGIIGFYVTSKIFSLKEVKAALQSVNATYKIAKETAFAEQNANAVKQSVGVLKQAMLQYAQKHGAEGLAFLNKMVGKLPATKFEWERNPEQLYEHSWLKHKEMWDNLGINSAEALKSAVDDVIRNGRKVVYKQYDNAGNFIGDEYGFYEEARNIFVAAKEDGRLWTAFRPGTNWDQSGAGLNYVMNRKWVFELK